SDTRPDLEVPSRGSAVRLDPQQWKMLAGSQAPKVLRHVAMSQPVSAHVRLLAFQSLVDMVGGFARADSSQLAPEELRVECRVFEAALTCLMELVDSSQAGGWSAERGEPFSHPAGDGTERWEALASWANTWFETVDLDAAGWEIVAESVSADSGMGSRSEVLETVFVSDGEPPVRKLEMLLRFCRRYGPLGSNDVHRLADLVVRSSPSVVPSKVEKMVVDAAVAPSELPRFLAAVGQVDRYREPMVVHRAEVWRPHMSPGVFLSNFSIEELVAGVQVDPLVFPHLLLTFEGSAEDLVKASAKR
ncbi:MAG: hypothetical protein ACF8TS_14525, partial [Maioricimonas sp. JB049]